MSTILSWFSWIPDVLAAIILLVIAFLAALLAQSLVVKLLKKLNGEKALGKLGVKDTETGSAVAFVGKLVYFIVFLLFLPAVLDKLGMKSVSAPITNLVSAFLDFLPKLIAAGLIIAVGMFLAKLIRQLLIPLLRAVKVDTLQEKAGIDVNESTAISSVIANIVYGLIILVVITSALDQLAISQPAGAVVNAVFDLIPNVLGAIVIIVVGVFISKLVAKLLESLLAGVGTDSLLEKITGNANQKVHLSKVIGEVVRCVLIIIFLVQGINVLGLPVLTQIGTAIIGYMPLVLSAVIILAIGVFAATTVEALLVKKFPSAKAGALAAKIAIYVLAAFLCLSQLGIANTIVETTFILIIAALAVAVAVAFGVGGRKFAENTLDKLEKKIDDNDKQ